jgi:hypothetical protein
MWFKQSLASAVCAAGLAGLLAQASACSRPEPGTYKSPEEAVAALQSAIGTGDEKRWDEMFGPKSFDLLLSGDAEEDKKAGQHVKDLIAEKVAFDDAEDGSKVALLGKEEWPFPIPLVKAAERWRFDTEKGRSELLNRRIGYYELLTLDSVRAYVVAQHEYALANHDGNPKAYAQRLRSTPGHQDGLYWPVAEGEADSPLGDLLGNATAHSLGDPEPQPFQGYWFRILKAQGENAPGGARDYVNAKGLMTGGFALIAWPAKYGNSGIMTFIINRRGIPFQKDLGPETEKAAAEIQAFDPDASWSPTGDVLPDDETDEAAPETPVQ